MKVHIPKAFGRRLIASSAAVAALAAGQALGQTEDELTDYPFGRDIAGFSLDGSMEAGTIPAAPPGLPPRESIGAMGPIRWDELRRHQTDPSIRDTHPLTMNGLWEQQPENVVTYPGGVPISQP